MNENTQLATRQQFDLSPQTFDQALTFSQYLADSDLVPKDFKGKPANCLIAMQWGSELGLKPLQAMQNLAIINGRPALWGDAVIALVRSSPLCEYVTEEDNGDTAVCRVKRRGEPEQVRTFSTEDAKKAGLLGKQGPWSQYPKRMRQMRARAFALRDVFPDVLRGLPVAEEVQDMGAPPPKDMGPAEVVRQEPEAWPADRWAKGLPKWVQGVREGKPLEDVLAWLGSKATVTPEQEQELRDAVQAATKPAHDVQDVAPKFTADQLEQQIRNAQDKDDLYEAGALLDAITDEAQRMRLTELFDARAAELEA